jgi:hypothetical protein
MSLADYSGGKYLREGETEVGITGLRFFTYNSGTRGVEFAVSAGNGAVGKVGFTLKDTTLWKLAGFADCCGLTKDDQGQIDPPGERGFDLFVGRRFVAVATPSSYVKDGVTKNVAEITDWLPAGTKPLSNLPKPPPAPRNKTTTHGAPPPKKPVPEYDAEKPDEVPF